MQFIRPSSGLLLRREHLGRQNCWEIQLLALPRGPAHDLPPALSTSGNFPSKKGPTLLASLKALIMASFRSSSSWVRPPHSQCQHHIGSVNHCLSDNKVSNANNCCCQERLHWFIDGISQMCSVIFQSPSESSNSLTAIAVYLSLESRVCLPYTLIQIENRDLWMRQSFEQHAASLTTSLLMLGNRPCFCHVNNQMKGIKMPLSVSERKSASSGAGVRPRPVAGGFGNFHSHKSEQREHASTQCNP